MSHLNHQKIMLLAAHGAEEEQVSQLQRAILAASGKPATVSVEQGVINSWSGQSWGCSFPVDAHVSETLAMDYDMVIVPAGERSIDKLLQNPHTERLLSSFMEAGKAIVVFGDAVRVLHETGVATHVSMPETGVETFDNVLSVADASVENLGHVVTHMVQVQPVFAEAA